MRVGVVMSLINDTSVAMERTSYSLTLLTLSRASSGRTCVRPFTSATLINSDQLQAKESRSGREASPLVSAATI